jgi:hypothetical protein
MMKRLLFTLVPALLVAVAFEGGAFGALEVLRAKHYVYEVPRDTQPLDYATRMHVGDPVLGWPLKQGRDAPGGAYRDESGARWLPAFPDPATPACASLYGDSFLESIEQDEQHAAANLLARALGCRVTNFGQAGYGTDQSLMRYQRNAADKASTVVLGRMLENMRRNINRNRDALSGGRDYNREPRFILGPDGSLVFVPMPALNEEECRRSVGLAQPLLRLEYEKFQAGGELLGPMAGSTFTLALAKNLGNYGLRARIRGYHSNFAVLYEPGHPTRALELTFAILKAFHAEAARRTQRGVVLLLPTLDVLTYHVKTSIWVNQPLLDLLQREAIPCMDFGPYFASRRNRDAAAYVAASGHYIAAAYEMLASMMAEQHPMTGKQ